MASDESTTMADEFEDTHDAYYHDNDDYDHYHHRHRVQHSALSRLSVCTSYDGDGDDDDDEVRYDDDDDDGGGANVMTMSMSRLSVEDGDEADGELTDSQKNPGGERLQYLATSDSDKEPGCYSLPATPPRHRRRNYPGGGCTIFSKSCCGGKAYASENEAQKGNRGSSRRSQRVKREFSSWLGHTRDSSVSCGESDQGGSPVGGGGLVVIARPKGGGRALCMDLEEVKACKDLGFELEHERMEISGRVSVSTIDTSSGGNSPIANWRISSPGDDPRDVKARLKMWAQAVALASASRHGS